MEEEVYMVISPQLKVPEFDVKVHAKDLITIV